LDDQTVGCQHISQHLTYTQGDWLLEKYLCFDWFIKVIQFLPFFVITHKTMDVLVHKTHDYVLLRSSNDGDWRPGRAVYPDSRRILSDSRAVIDLLLDSLSSIHQHARSTETALGPAIRVAFKLMSSIGGKMIVFQSSLPTTGQGAPTCLGADKEHTLLSPADTFYGSNAIDFCRQQVIVDTFKCH
jgi:hypothetical protein